MGLFIGRLLGSNPSIVTAFSLRLNEPFHSLALVQGGLQALKNIFVYHAFWLTQGGGEGVGGGNKLSSALPPIETASICQNL